MLAGMDTAFNINSSFTIGPVTKALGVSTPSVSGSFNLPDVNVHGCTCLEATPSPFR